MINATYFHLIPFYVDIKVWYGYTQTLFCGDSVPHTPPGHWFHNGEQLDVYSRSYTITYANFSDDGEYQCRRNGRNVYSTHLIVYGKS